MEATATDAKMHEALARMKRQALIMLSAAEGLEKEIRTNPTPESAPRRRNPRAPTGRPVVWCGSRSERSAITHSERSVSMMMMVMNIL